MKRTGPTTAAASCGLDREAVARAAGLAVSQVRVVDEVGSTNAELIDGDPGLGAFAPAVLIASRQTDGRGRRGRRWLSDPDDCLTMSIRMHRIRDRNAPPLTGLTLALGTALAEVLAPQVEGLALKWPNDLLRDDRKCAGMLVETRVLGEIDRIVIGLGLNWRTPASLRASVTQPVAGLFDSLPGPQRRAQLSGAIAGALIERARQFLADGMADTVLRWARFDGLDGRAIAVAADERPVLTGIAAGIDSSGALRVRTADGIVTVSVGDVSVRALPDADDGQGPRG